MAKSVYTQLMAGEIEIVHGGQEFKVLLPAWLSLREKYLKDRKELLDWLDYNDVLANVLHEGLRQSLISYRAKYRKTDKSGAQVKLTSDEIAKIEETEFKPGLITEPGTGSKAGAKAKARQMLKESLESAGLDKEQIDNALAEFDKK